MVKITNGVNTFEVTKGAFDGIFSRQGYNIIKTDAKSSKEENRASEDTSKNAEEQFVEDLMEKPIGQWKKDEVKKFAAVNDIDLTGTKNVNEAKEIIKEFIVANK